MRTFELRRRKPAKFWKVELQGDLIVTLQGKVGTAGTREGIRAEDPEQAKKQHDKLVKQKPAEGYAETTPVPPRPRRCSRRWRRRWSKTRTTWRRTWPTPTT
jgi:predicted DNA-binding WGR domain protein